MKQLVDPATEALYQTRTFNYPFRMAAYIASGLIVLAGWLEGHFPPFSPWLAIFLLIFPNIGLGVAYLTRGKWNHETVSLGLLIVDAALLGILTCLTGFSLVPLLTQMLLLLFYAQLRRNYRTTLYVLATLLFSASVSQLILNMTPTPGTPTFTAVVCLLLLFIQLYYTAFILRRYHEQTLFWAQGMMSEQQRQQTLAQDLAKYLSPQVWQMTFNRKASDPLKTQRKKLTVFFSDIRGFSDLSEELEPEELSDLLNSYLTEMSRIVIKHGGIIDKFMGDGIMVFFGDPVSKGARQDAQAAVSMAIEMRKRMHELKQEWREQGITRPLQIRMGINTGYCTVGRFGAETRMEYTIIGREVNLASRLENTAEPNEILVSSETYSLVKDEIMGRDKGLLQVKGFSRPVQMYQIVDNRSELDPTRSFLAHELPGFSLQMDPANLANKDIERVIQVLQHAMKQLHGRE